jgi:hypothetical protein
VTLACATFAGHVLSCILMRLKQLYKLSSLTLDAGLCCMLFHHWCWQQLQLQHCRWPMLLAQLECKQTYRS